MSNRDMDKITIDPDVLKKILGKGDEEEFTTEGGVISVCPNANVYFYAEIIPQTILKLNNILIQLMKENLAEGITKDREPDPIYLHINSPGGLCSAGFLGYDTIIEVKKRVNVITAIEGHAASAATLLSIAGSKRLITPSSDMLIHELSTWLGGRASEITEEYRNMMKIQTRLENIYLSHSKFEKEELQELLKKDRLLSAEEALEKGLVDEIKMSIF